MDHLNIKSNPIDYRVNIERVFNNAFEVPQINLKLKKLPSLEYKNIYKKNIETKNPFQLFPSSSDITKYFKRIYPNWMWFVVNSVTNI